jgi:hypothetical protein
MDIKIILYSFFGDVKRQHSIIIINVYTPSSMVETENKIPFELHTFA